MLVARGLSSGAHECAVYLGTLGLSFGAQPSTGKEGFHRQKGRFLSRPWGWGGFHSFTKHLPLHKNRPRPLSLRHSAHPRKFGSQNRSGASPVMLGEQWLKGDPGTQGRKQHQASKSTAEVPGGLQIIRVGGGCLA